MEFKGIILSKKKKKPISKDSVLYNPIFVTSFVKYIPF